jgi:hypothetical protein
MSNNSPRTYLDPFDELRVKHGSAPLTPSIIKMAEDFKKLQKDRYRKEYFRLSKEKERSELHE